MRQLILAVAMTTACGSLGRNEQVANEELLQWANGLGLDVARHECNSVDSDGDGYVSCTYTLKGKEDELRQVECAAAFNLQHGCRQPKIHVPTPVIIAPSSDSSRSK